MCCLAFALLLSSSRKVVVQDLSFRKGTTTAKTDSRLLLSGMTTKESVIPECFCRGSCVFARKQKRQNTDSRLLLSGMTTKASVIPECFCRGSCSYARKQKRQITDSRLQLSGMTLLQWHQPIPSTKKTGQANSLRAQHFPKRS